MTQFINRFFTVIGQIAQWLTLGVVLLTFIVVVMRYGFNLGSIALQESLSYFHAFAFMLGIAYTLHHNEHVRVDVFYGAMSESRKAWVDLLGTVLLMWPTMFFVVWISAPYVADSWAILEGSNESGSLDAVYILKTALLIMPVLVILQSFQILSDNLKTLKGAH